MDRAVENKHKEVPHSKAFSLFENALAVSRLPINKPLFQVGDKMNARYLWNALKNGAEVHDYAWVDQGLQTQPDIWKIDGVNLREIVRIARNWDEHMWLIPSQEQDEYWYIPF